MELSLRASMNTPGIRPCRQLGEGKCHIPSLQTFSNWQPSHTRAACDKLEVQRVVMSWAEYAWAGLRTRSASRARQPTIIGMFGFSPNCLANIWLAKTLVEILVAHELAKVGKENELELVMGHLACQKVRLLSKQ